MGFNYAREKRKFDEKWKKLEDWYRESGMSEDAIREMREYDWSEFNSTRKFYRYGDDDVDVESIAEEDGDCAQIRGITTSAVRIDELMTTLVEQQVSPTVLEDVVQDWL